MRIEDESLGFGFSSMRCDLFAVPEEADARGVADSDDKFTRGVEGSRSGCDQGFLREELSVRGDGDPGVFAGADD